MRQKTERHQGAAEHTIKDIRRRTRKRYSSEEKICWRQVSNRSLISGSLEHASLRHLVLALQGAGPPAVGKTFLVLTLVRTPRFRRSIRTTNLSLELTESIVATTPSKAPPVMRTCCPTR